MFGVVTFSAPSFLDLSRCLVDSMIGCGPSPCLASGSQVVALVMVLFRFHVFSIRSLVVTLPRIVMFFESLVTVS